MSSSVARPYFLPALLITDCNVLDFSSSDSLNITISGWAQLCVGGEDRKNVAALKCVSDSSIHIYVTLCRALSDA